MCSRSVVRWSVFVTAELADEGLEVLGLAEVAIDRGKADVGDLVQRGERVHHRLADMSRRDLGLARAFQAPNDAVDHALQPVLVDWPLAQRDLHRTQQLLAIERLALAVALHNDQLAQLDTFEGGEARAAVGALPPPADGGVIVRRSGVFDLGILVSAKRTAHSRPPKASSSAPVDREPLAQGAHFLAHLVFNLAVVSTIGREPIEHAHDHLPDRLELLRPEAATGRRRRAEADAGRDRRLLGIELDAVLVAGDAGLFQAVLGNIAGQLLRS